MSGRRQSNWADSEPLSHGFQAGSQKSQLFPNLFFLHIIKRDSLHQLQNGIVGTPGILRVPLPHFLVAGCVRDIYERQRRVEISQQELELIIQH
jgi:hypothetical protein